MREFFQTYADSIHWSWAPYIALALMLLALAVCVRDALPDPLQALLDAIWPAGTLQVKLAAIKRRASDLAEFVLALWLVAAVLAWAASLVLLLAGPALGIALVTGAVCMGLAGLAWTALVGGGWLGMLIGFAIDPPKSRGR